MQTHIFARALGGEVAGRDAVLCPGPGHSAHDRSLAVKFDPAAPDGFLTYSHAGDDWKICRDSVRSRLGLPPWQPGDEQQRTIPPSKVQQWDMTAVGSDVAEGARPPSEDDLARTERALAIWNESVDPRSTLAERYLDSRKLVLTDDLARCVLRFHPRCPWRDENTGKTDACRR